MHFYFFFHFCCYLSPPAYAVQIASVSQHLQNHFDVAILTYLSHGYEAWRARLENSKHLHALTKDAKKIGAFTKKCLTELGERKGGEQTDENQPVVIKRRRYSAGTADGDRAVTMAEILKVLEDCGCHTDEMLAMSDRCETGMRTAGAEKVRRVMVCMQEKGFTPKEIAKMGCNSLFAADLGHIASVVTYLAGEDFTP